MTLVPFHGLRVGEVQYGILGRKLTFGVLHSQAFLHQFPEQTVLRGEVWELPQTGVEAIGTEVFHELYRVLEVLGAELVVALPVNLEPAGIKVDDIAWEFVVPELFSHAASFLLGEVGDTTLPGSEGPDGRQFRTAHQFGVGTQDFFRVTQDDEQVGLLVGHEETGVSDVGVAEVHRDRSRRVHEHAVAPVGEPEWDRLVHIWCFRSLWVGDEEVQFLSGLVQGSSRFATAVDFLTGSQAEYRFHRTGVVRASFHEEERMRLHLRRVVVAQRTGMGEYLTVLVPDYQTPRIFLDFQASLRALQHDRFAILGSLPQASSIGRFLHQHDIIFRVLRNDRRGVDAYTYHTLVYRVHLELQLWALVVLGFREVLVLERTDPIAVQVERLTRVQVLTAPLDGSPSGGRVEVDQAVRTEVGVGRVLKLITHVYTGVLKVRDTIVGSKLGAGNQCAGQCSDSQ